MVLEVKKPKEKSPNLVQGKKLKPTYYEADLKQKLNIKAPNPSDLAPN